MKLDMTQEMYLSNSINVIEYSVVHISINLSSENIIFTVTFKFILLITFVD